MTELTRMCRVLDRDTHGYNLLVTSPSAIRLPAGPAQTRVILTSSILDFGNLDSLFGNVDSIVAQTFETMEVDKYLPTSLVRQCRLFWRYFPCLLPIVVDDNYLVANHNIERARYESRTCIGRVMAHRVISNRINSQPLITSTLNTTLSQSKRNIQT